MENIQASNPIPVTKKTMMPIGDLLNACFGIYKTKAWVMGALMLLSFFVYIIAGITLVPLWILVFLGHFNISFILVAALLFLIALLIILVCNVLFQLAVLYSVKEQDVSLTTQSIKKILVISWNNLASYVWISFLKTIIILTGFILFIIPGILFCIWFSLSSMVFIFENIKGYKALQRSKQLVNGYWWPVFGRLALLGVVAILFACIPGLGKLISLLIVAPFSVVYMYVIYGDLKKLKS